jgi:hypothetical protein
VSPPAISRRGFEPTERTPRQNFARGSPPILALLASPRVGADTPAGRHRPGGGPHFKVRAAALARPPT